MHIKNISKKVLASVLCLVMIFTFVCSNMNGLAFSSRVNADNLPVNNFGSGSIGIGSNESEAAKLPRTSTQGTYRFTTDNYNNNHEALDTNDWASNWLWDLEGDRENDSTNALSGTAYAFPLCYLMKKDGLRVTKPAMTSSATNVSAYNIKDNDTLCDFKISPDWTCTNNNIDEITDWSYKAVTTNPSNTNQKMTTTMTQGSPFMFLELSNSNVVYLQKLRETFPSTIVYEDTYNGAKVLVFRTNDITSSVNGFPSATYQYYALFLPQDATVEHQGTTDTTGNDKIGKLKITFSSNSKAYMSLAWVYESQSHSDDVGINYAKEYRPYAFNFITNTTADYSYNESTGDVATKYTYTVNKKSESTADGTVMGIQSHQYKYMTGYSYMGNQAITLRGYMKFMKGSTYTTHMTYKGILPYMPTLGSDDTAGKETLQNYVDDFMNKHMSGAGSWTLASDEGNETYYHGKKLNRSAQVVAAAKAVGDEESAAKVLNGLEKNLEDWFTYSGNSDKHYFTYLGEGVGVLLGFPTSFNAVDQFNDHHFHYGYFIQSAACVGLYDKQWLNDYKDVIKQLIYDIACPYRNNTDCVADCGNAYPYLRSFSPYECHSWASGYEDERTGNNQESTSEAINAWAGIILYGELTGDTKIRDLGVYLYTSEVAAADDYWFDKDEDTYKIDSSKYTAPMASMVWGGKADYGTWFGMEYTQGIQICPMQSWSFYLASDGENISGSDYIKKYYDADKTYAEAKGGSTSLWNDMWASYYALADPDAAMNTVWSKENINDGESQAHTYHFIKALQNYGTPDLSFTSSCSTASVFKKNGVYTFAVYNPSSSTKTVTFSNSEGYTASVKAAPNTMTLVNSDELSKASYTIEYYAKDLDSNNYSLIESSIKYADAGANVSATAKEFTGYLFDASNANNVQSGVVDANGNLVLKLYYTRNTYTISYDLVGGVKNDTTLYPASYVFGETKTLDTPKKDGYDFYGWYKESTYTTKVPSITAKTYGNITLYAKWIPAGTILINEDMYLTFDGNMNGTFNIVGDTKYNAVNVLYKVVNTESEARELAESKAEVGFVSWGLDSVSTGWSRTEDFSSRKDQYIVFYFIRYSDDGGFKSDYGYGKISNEGSGTSPIETTVVSDTTSETITDTPVVTTPVPTTTTSQGATDKPNTPAGLVYAGNDSLPYYFAWQGMENVTFNFYVNGTCIATGLTGASYNAPSEYFAEGGEYTIGITAVRDGVESDMLTINHTFSAAETTEAPTTTAQPTTTEEPTTAPKPEINVHENVKVEGFQISTISEGSRVIGSVEPTIEGKKVSKWGFVYSLVEIDNQSYNVDESDIYVGSNNQYVASMESTDAGTISVPMGDSTTATYYTRTTLFGNKTAKEFYAKYKVRAYALMEDGTYYYSTIASYRVFNIAKVLYNNALMNNYSGHQYLYNDILKVVDSNYKEVDYDWTGTIVK